MNSTSSLTCVFHALADFGTGNKQTNVDSLLHRPLDLNSRMYTHIHTPTVVQGGGGWGGVDEIYSKTKRSIYLSLEPVLYEVSQLGKPG